MPRRYFTIVLIGACAALAGTASSMSWTSTPAAAHAKHHSPRSSSSLTTAAPSPIPTNAPTPAPAPSPSPTPRPSPSPSPASGNYHVAGNQIIDPSGARFVIKGTDTIYGRFFDPNSGGFDLDSYNAAASTFATERGLGYTAIRLDAGPAGLTYLGTAEFWIEMDNVINLATNGGMVVIVSPYGDSSALPSFDGQVAARYMHNPRVWVKNANEPDPLSTWATWQTNTQAEVNAIRQAGNTAPIVLNGPGYSWDWAQYPSYRINDSSLVLGPHRYANGSTSFDPATVDWAVLTTQGYAVYMDEWGNDDVGAPNPAGSSTWNQQFGAFLATWTNTQGGSGGMGFNWYWSDGDSMTSPIGVLNQWGQEFQSDFVVKVQ
jgi:Cellulase (glycosyl hydrolase family 5)